MRNKIVYPDLSLINKSEHIAFHADSLTFMQEWQENAPATSSNSLATLIEKYKEAIDKEKSNLTIQWSSKLTKSIQLLDQKRTQHVKFLFKISRAMLHSPQEKEVEAAKYLCFVLQPLQKCERKPIKQKTGIFQAIVNVLRQEKSALALEQIGIGYITEKINEVNLDFAEMERERTSELREKIDSGKNRKQTDTIFREIIDHINALQQLASSEATTLLISKINKLTDQTRHYYALRMGGDQLVMSNEYADC